MDSIFELSLSKIPYPAWKHVYYFLQCIATILYDKPSARYSLFCCANTLFAVGVAANTHFQYDHVLRRFSAVFYAPQDGQFHYTSSLRHSAFTEKDFPSDCSKYTALMHHFFLVARNGKSSCHFIHNGLSST